MTMKIRWYNNKDKTYQNKMETFTEAKYTKVNSNLIKEQIRNKSSTVTKAS
ncbi:calcineurin-binding protein cabin-1-like [Sesbania bispinosa]|nr:calcineurin-binding protein cabin-1-like [Sesbania bispinosa]